MNAAEEALASGTSELIVIDGEEIEAYPFGTDGKPTDGSWAWVKVRRYVDTDGTILVTVPGSGTMYSGLTMNRLCAQWNAESSSR